MNNDIEKNTSEVKAPKKNKLKKFFKSRKAKKGSLAIIIVAVFIAIVVLLNVVTGILVETYPNLKFDMTASRTYELQDDTVQYIKQLDKDVTVNVLVTESTFKRGLSATAGSEYFVQAYNLLKKMAATNSRLKLKFIDLSANPTFVNKYDDVNWTGSDAQNLLLIESGDKHEAFTLTDCFTYDSEYYSYYGTYYYTATTIEQTVVTGVLDVTSNEKVSVDFFTGSGETADVYSSLMTLLKQNAYDVKEVNIMTEKPRENADVAFLYAPTVDLSEESVQKLEDWLENDGDYGKTLVYIPQATELKAPNLDAFLEKYGMKVSDGYAFCTSVENMVGNPTTFLVDYDNDTYTENLKNKDVRAVVSYSRDIEIKDESVASPLLKQESGVGVLPFDAELESEDDIQDYLKDSAVITAAIGKKTSDDGEVSNVAVFGSSVMFSESAIGTSSFNNANYIVNFCNTVTNRGDMGITIVSAQVDNGELGNTNQAVTYAMEIIFIVVVPIIILVIGLIIFIRRRNR